MTSIIAMESFKETIGTGSVGSRASVIFSLYAVYVFPFPNPPRVLACLAIPMN
jgi:hypothetical protein